ncbi:hypothetical protein CIPAW_13G132700 [Carya illinoinensis]|uniref:Uncharacterized protein n=1 Tax=Carya illinoinensis TaxID=32201 RepID=A0A8T1NQW1_CARIL|nr:hypothetical protein CIPAW_13G132700 [Carya illinoinensis]
MTCWSLDASDEVRSFGSIYMHSHSAFSQNKLRWATCWPRAWLCPDKMRARKDLSVHECPRFLLHYPWLYCPSSTCQCLALINGGRGLPPLEVLFIQWWEMGIHLCLHSTYLGLFPSFNSTLSHERLTPLNL